VLQWWEQSSRRRQLRERLLLADGIDPDQVILSPERARAAGLTSTICFPQGNLAPEGAVIKSTAIDPRVLDADGVYRKTGPARIFFREKDAVAAIKGQAANKGQTASPIRPGDILVLAGRGPLGSGMEEIYQVTSALKHLSWGREVAVITDARFSGVSTGACIGHVGPEALAGGPIGKLLDGDMLRITVDTRQLIGSVDLVGERGEIVSPEHGARLLATRAARSELTPDPQLPPETRLWAALQSVGGGTWGGCVYDIDAIIERLK
jgi:dihydroxyacid dehydratase/phosphogluconate dehydratase